MAQLKPNVTFDHPKSKFEARLFHTNELVHPNKLFKNEEGSINDPSNELDSSIRLVSLGLIARHLFEDMIVRRIVGFTRLLKLASNIWDS